MKGWLDPSVRKSPSTIWESPLISLHTIVLVIALVGGLGQAESRSLLRDPLHSFSKALVFVSSSLVSLQTCLEAFSMAEGLLPRKRSRLGRK